MELDLSVMPNADMVLKRHEAFWNRAIIDRVPVNVTFWKEKHPVIPEKTYATWDEKWLDVDFRAEQMDITIDCIDYPYDALPIAFPNLGPELFSAWCGCGYHFTRDTAWSDPCITDPETQTARLDMNHPLFRKLMRFTDLLLERGKGKFITGLTDFHPGGDHLAALRDPQELCVDVLVRPEWIKQALADTEAEYYAAYGAFAAKLRGAGQPVTSWIPIAHEGTMYIPSNDFSCMISPAQFEDLFLPGIRRECRFYDRSIYHLDGPGALKHLDAILSIPELDAVQWVPTAGSESYCRWKDVYQRIQKAGKGIWLTPLYTELDEMMATLRPEGVFINGIAGLSKREDIENAIKYLSRWK